MSLDLLNGLNIEQKQAVLHKEGPLLVIAGAGSGKTKALTVRIAHLLKQGVNAREILAVTFTNKAAKEMQERVKNLLITHENMQIPNIGTFHSIGVKILRREIGALNREQNFTIFDSTDTKSLAKTLLKEKDIKTSLIAPATLLSKISSWKNQNISPEKVLNSIENYRDSLLAELYKKYEEVLLKTNALDFDDLILLPVKIFQSHPEVLSKYQDWWKFVMIDEYQDTNYLQYLFAQMISEKHNNICAIGDSDQSIYKFRGADLSNILNFQKEYKNAVIVKLEQNYRSTKNILKAADSVIKQNSNRIDKTMITENKEGDPVTVFELEDEREEANYVFDEISQLISKGKNPSDIAILYRTNAQSRTLEESALKYGIPYNIVGGLKFYSRAEVKDILAYLRFILNKDDGVSLERIINVPPRKIGKTSIVRLKSFAISQNLEWGSVLSHVETSEGIPTIAKNKIIEFDKMIQYFRSILSKHKLSEFMEKVIEKTGYEAMLSTQGEDGQVRLENIRELVSVAKKYDEVDPERALSLFLEEVALISDLDNLSITSDKVTLMTLHASKGLEFGTVFLTGCEENIFPSSRSLFKPDDLEEERRLMYVGITRAKENLNISLVKSRMLYGDIMYNSPSRFIAEIPQDLCDGNYFAKTSLGSSFSVSHSQVVKHGYEVNDFVEHKKFGIGKVVNVEGDILTIIFKSIGEKRLVASIAPLEKVEVDEFLE